MSNLHDIVIVGASLAGLRSAEALRAGGYRGALTVIGDEPELPYDRPPLSKELLRGELGPSDIKLAGVDELQVDWKLGTRAVQVDPDRKAIATADGGEVPYGALVVATGSGVRALPVFEPGTVHTLRTIADALRLRASLKPQSRLLIVGCGFVGVEVASSAKALGANVTVVTLDPPLALAGKLVSDAATNLMRRAGIRVHVGQTVTSAEIVDGVHRVGLADGASLEADQIVVSVGSVPNTSWLAGSGAEVGDGVLCDERLRVVGLADVVAAGDIVRWPNPLFGGLTMRIEHWSNAVEQSVAAARTLLAGPEAAPFGAVPSFWSDHFGTRLQSVGLPGLADRFEVIAGDPEEGSFAAAAYVADVLVGGVAYGSARALVALRIKLAKQGAALTQVIG